MTVTIDPPPAVQKQPARLFARLLPVVISLAGVGFMAAAFASGSAVTHNPMFLTFPVMTLASVVVAGATGRGGRRPGIDDDRADYLDYLSRLRRTVTETSAVQSRSLNRTYPVPDSLWTLIGGPRMWERRADDPAAYRVRVGVGTLRLTTPLIAPDIPHPADPVTAGALRRFIATHAMVTGPDTIDVRAPATVTIEGDADSARGLARAMICQLAVLHSPDLMPIVGVIADTNRPHWDWLKWLPHNHHPVTVDAAGSARMVYGGWAEARSALVGVRRPWGVVVADLGAHLARRGEPASDARRALTLTRHGLTRRSRFWSSYLHERKRGKEGLV